MSDSNSCPYPNWGSYRTPLTSDDAVKFRLCVQIGNAWDAAWRSTAGPPPHPFCDATINFAEGFVLPASGTPRRALQPPRLV